jgi:Periplasmic binding protein
VNGTGSTAVIAKWAAEQGSKKFGFLYPFIPGFDTITNTLKAYIAKAEPNMQFFTQTTPLAATAADFDGALVGFKNQGVDTIHALVSPDLYSLVLQEASVQQMGPADGIRWVFGPPAYDQNNVNPAMEGAYVLSWTKPWESNDPAAKKAKKIIGKQKSLDSTTALGFNQIAIFEDLLNQIKGPITKESIIAAAQKSKPFSQRLSPYKVSIHKPDTNAEGGQVVQVKNGKFIDASEYVVVPAKDLD